MEQGGNDMDEREELKERFNFTKPVIFQDLEKGFSVTALSDQIIIEGDAEHYETDLPRMLAMAKLGEKDPLLMTFVIMTEIEERDRKYAEPFHDLCKPLQDAWVMKMLRLPCRIYTKRRLRESKAKRDLAWRLADVL